LKTYGERLLLWQWILMLVTVIEHSVTVSDESLESLRTFTDSIVALL